MRSFRLRFISLAVPLMIFGAILLVATDASAQSTRRRTSTPIPAPTPTPSGSDAMIISRAEDFPDENSRAIPPDPNDVKTADASSLATLEALGNRIKNLEASREVPKTDPDAKQKRLLLNLDILTRAEQRSESLRKQVFELLEKESAVKTKLDSLDYDLRPEVIERSTALIGSLRPEEIREARRKSLESEKANLTTMLNEIQRTRSSLEVNLQRADLLVEKLRLKFEKEIDNALDEDSTDNN